MISALSAEAVTTVGFVLGEAMTLYVGYGALTAVLEPRLTAALEE